MRIKPILWLLGVLGFFWALLYNAVRPFQHIGDNRYGPWAFVGGCLLLLTLSAEWARRRFRLSNTKRYSSGPRSA